MWWMVLLEAPVRHLLEILTALIEIWLRAKCCSKVPTEAIWKL